MSVVGAEQALGARATLPRGARCYGKSAYTPVKQAHLGEIATMVLCAVGALWSNPRHQWAYKRFVYFDLHAGPGLDDDGDRGSSLVVLDRAALLDVPVEGVLFEQDAARARRLAVAVAAEHPEAFVRVAAKRCEDGLAEAIDALRARTKLSAVYGLLYADPTTTVPWDALAATAALLRRVDIVISLPAATEKRLLGAGLMRPENALRSALGTIAKTKWFIRTLMERHQFTMLLGTNYPDMKAIKRIGLVALDSDQGQWLLDRAAYTHAERTSQGPWQQLALPGFAR